MPRGSRLHSPASDCRARVLSSSPTLWVHWWLLSREVTCSGFHFNKIPWVAASELGYETGIGGSEMPEPRCPAQSPQRQNSKVLAQHLLGLLNTWIPGRLELKSWEWVCAEMLKRKGSVRSCKGQTLGRLESSLALLSRSQVGQGCLPCKQEEVS